MKYLYRILALLTLLLLLIVLGSYLVPVFYPDSDITRKPPLSGGYPAHRPVPVSSISIPIHIPVSSLETWLDRKIPHLLADETRNRKWKKRVIGIKTQVRARVSYRVKRAGPVQVATHDGFFRISAPLAISASVKKRGTLRPSVSTDGRLMLHIDVLEAGIDPQWRPTVKLRPHFRWIRRPEVELGFIDVSIGELAGDELQEALDDAARDLEQDLANDGELIEKARKYWKKLQQPELLEDNPQVWLVAHPENIALHHLTPDNGEITTHLTLAARIHGLIGDRPVLNDTTGLPELAQYTDIAPGYIIHLPVRFNYTGLNHRLDLALKNKPIELENGARFLVQDFELYNSGSRIVLGVRFTATASWRILDTSGTVYLAGTPAFDEHSSQLVMHDFDYTRRVSNPLLHTASWVLQEPLKQELGRRLIYDLSEDISELKQEIHELLNQGVYDGLTGVGTVENLTIQQIVLTAYGMDVDLLARGKLGIRAVTDSDGEE